MRRLPAKENYKNFLSEFSEKLNHLSPSTCFYIYGSTKNGRITHGRSDIDGGIILDSESVTPKDTVYQISKLLASCLNEKKLSLDVNLLDRQTISDGRFCDYPKSYVDFFKSGGSDVLSGPNYLPEMTYVDPKNQDLSARANNFRKMRNTALFWETYKHNPAHFKNSSRRGFETLLDSLLKLPKNLMLIKTGQTRFEKSDALSLAQELSPNLDHSIIKEVLEIYRNPSRWARLIDDSNIDSLRTFHDTILTHYEKMVSDYMNET